MTAATIDRPTDASLRADGYDMRAEFVPFSKSRNAKPDKGGEIWRSLNWQVTLTRNGRDILTTDYSAGEAHCPSNKQGAQQTADYRARVDYELEHGKTAHEYPYAIVGGKPILPKLADVLSSLILDSSVLDAGGFEDWAGDFGYDTDSREAERIYRACLDLALKLRAGLGETELQRLRDLFQDY